MHQQPNDKMPGFRILKTKSRKHEGEQVAVQDAFSTQPYMRVVNRLLKEVDKASSRTITKFMLYLPTWLSTAFTVEHIQTGWKKAGAIPYDAVKILRCWPKLDTLTPDKADGIMAALPALTVLGNVQGFLRDAQLEEAVSEFVPAECFDNKGKVDVHDLCVNRWRATWMNSAGTIQHRADLVAQKKEKEDERLAKKKQRKDKSEKKAELAKGSKRKSDDTSEVPTTRKRSKRGT